MTAMEINHHRSVPSGATAPTRAICAAKRYGEQKHQTNPPAHRRACSQRTRGRRGEKRATSALCQHHLHGSPVRVRFHLKQPRGTRKLTTRFRPSNPELQGADH